MKTIFAAVFTILTCISCVQKSSKKSIIVKLHTEGIKNIQTVGIRGNENPISWDDDLVLKPTIKDSLYIATFSIVTGYKFTEVKFAVNGQLELNNKENRKITYSNKDTTIYEAKYNIPN